MRVVRSVAVGSVLLSLTACLSVTPPSPPPLPYVARGQEPGWLLRVDETGMRFTPMDGDAVSAAPRVQVTGDAITYEAENDARFSATVRAQLCTDPMSDMPFPDAVSVTVNGRTYRGCGGEPRSLLLGAWTVTDMNGKSANGKSAPAQPAVTIRFDDAGRVSGRSPCNAFSGAYELTGEGLRMPNAAATRMACAPAAMDAERAFFALMAEVTRFEISKTGELVLRANDGRAITARRAVPR